MGNAVEGIPNLPDAGPVEARNPEVRGNAVSTERECEIPLRACAKAREPPNVALMHLLSVAPSEADARRRLDGAITRARPMSAARHRLEEMAKLWREHPSAPAIVRRMSSLGESGSDWQRIFDDAARLSPEAGVALYSFGDPELLAAATREIVGRMQNWKLLSGSTTVLDLGCGTGRIATAIAPSVKRVVALEIAPEMARQTVANTKKLGNVNVVLGNGENISFLADETFDLVLAIDSFPYLVASGGAAVHMADIARVLYPGGHLLLMNYSYRRDLARDRREIGALAAATGFRVLRNGTGGLALWDGRAFLLRKRQRKKTLWAAPS